MTLLARLARSEKIRVCARDGDLPVQVLGKIQGMEIKVAPVKRDYLH
jgi:hypothetical protein